MGVKRAPFTLMLPPPAQLKRRRKKSSIWRFMDTDAVMTSCPPDSLTLRGVRIGISGALKRVVMKEWEQIQLLY